MYHCAIMLSIVASVVGAAATTPHAVQEGPKIPDGVIHVKLPPGNIRMERKYRDGKPLLRFSVGQTVIEARSLFLGDAKGVQQFEAIKEGMHWVRGKGGKGTVTDGVEIHTPGALITVRGNFLRVDELKAGSLYVTTPSIIFDFGPASKPLPR